MGDADNAPGDRRVKTEDLADLDRYIRSLHQHLQHLVHFAGQTKPSPEYNNKISSADQAEVDVAKELRMAADRIDKHLKKEVK